MRIAFFGGTFDPPHTGHLELARQILQSGKTDRVLFVPASDPPHKLNWKISSFADRLAMLEILTAGEPDMLVSDIERRVGLKPSYSHEIMKLLEKEFPGADLQLLIGGDSLAALHTWHDAKKIVAEYELLCYPRRGEAPDRRELARHWTPKEIDILLQSVLQMPFFDISSTAVRKSIRNGAEPENMDAKVLKYITDKGLYRETE